MVSALRADSENAPLAQDLLADPVTAGQAMSTDEKTRGLRIDPLAPCLAKPSRAGRARHGGAAALRWSTRRFGTSSSTRLLSGKFGVRPSAVPL